MEDDKSIAVLVSSVSKSIFYICITVVLCFFIDSCNLDKDIIEACESSCDGFGYHMESVTSGKCVCSDNKQSESKWVIPKTIK